MDSVLLKILESGHASGLKPFQDCRARTSSEMSGIVIVESVCECQVLAGLSQDILQVKYEGPSWLHFSLLEVFQMRLLSTQRLIPDSGL